jgi:hypothetical protein
MLSRGLVSALVACALIATMVSLAQSAAGDKRLDRVKGNVAYTAPDNSVHQVFGHDVLPDDDIALTQAKSAAALTLPDSSIVSLGENTRVQVGAFTTGTSGPGSTIVVQNGSLRFDIRRPAGGAANYHFTTTTSQIAVRGTVGLLSFLGGNTTVACLACAADSVTVTVGTQTVALATGQVVTVTATGAIASGAISSATLSSFSTASVSTSAATGPAAAVSGVAGATGGIAAGTAGIAAAAAGAVAAGVAVSTSHSPAPNVTTTPIVLPSPSPSPTVAPSPSPSPTPNAPLQLQQKNRAPAAIPAAAPPPAEPRPAIEPARGLPGAAGLPRANGR